MLLERPDFGDPETMESMGHALLARAEQIAAAGQGVSNRADSMTFLGPAATRYRASAQMARSSTEQIAAQVGDLGRMLIRAAATAREQIAQWELMAERMREAREP